MLRALGDNIIYNLLMQSTEASLCMLKREQALSWNQSWYIPKCADDGSFSMYQCKTVYGEKKCFCVAPHSGDVLDIHGTSEKMCKGE